MSREDVVLYESDIYQDAGDLVKAFAHGTRLKLIDLLCDSERCVEDLSNALGISIKSVSAHLRVMRIGGVLVARRQGKRVYYRVKNNQILDLYRHIVDVASLNELRTITSLK